MFAHALYHQNSNSLPLFKTIVNDDVNISSKLSKRQEKLTIDKIQMTDQTLITRAALDGREKCVRIVNHKENGSTKVGFSEIQVCDALKTLKCADGVNCTINATQEQTCAVNGSPTC
jgi:hypothetical protein